MKVLIDVGNTNIVLGFYDNDKTYRFVTNKTRSSDEYAMLLGGVLNNVEGVIISSVVPELNNILKDYFEKYFNVTPIFVGPGVKTGVKIQVDNPKEVGADLITAAASGIKKYGNNCLLIDLGTATTLSYIENQTLKGVIICAGIETSKKALIKNASLLSEVTFDVPNKVVGTNTSSAIRSGLLYGHAALIDGLIERIKTETKNNNIACVLTGGLSKIIKPLLKNNVYYDEDLVLEGLRYIYDLNK